MVPVAPRSSSSTTTPPTSPDMSEENPFWLFCPPPPRNERSSSVPSALAQSSPDVGFSLVCRQAPGLEAARVELSVYERWRDRTRSENTGWGGGPLQPACPLPAAGSSARGHAGCVLAVSVP